MKKFVAVLSAAAMMTTLAAWCAALPAAHIALPVRSAWVLSSAIRFLP